MSRVRKVRIEKCREREGKRGDGKDQKKEGRYRNGSEEEMKNKRWMQNKKKKPG